MNVTSRYYADGSRRDGFTTGRWSKKFFGFAWRVEHYLYYLWLAIKGHDFSEDY